MSYRLVIGHDKLVSRWTANELGVDEWMHAVAAIGVMRDETPVAGVVYYAYRWPTIEMACASIDTKWLNKGFLRTFFHYPFNILNCKRVVSLVDDDNYHALEFNRKLGFVKEAHMKDAHPNGDAILLRMLKSECRWINGQQRLKNDKSLCSRSAGIGASSITSKFRRHICQRFSEQVQ